MSEGEAAALTKDDIPEIVKAVVAALPPIRTDPGNPRSNKRAHYGARLPQKGGKRAP